jgi:diguanylate cyclase (GGDEF)-like protein
MKAPGLRLKIALLWSAASIAVAMLVAFVVLLTSGRLYTRQFLAGKLSLVTTIAAQVDGDLHATFTGVESIRDPGYRHLLAALARIKSREEHLTYLYTLNLDADGTLRYAVDADIAATDIAWVESDSFAFWVLYRDGRLSIDTEEQEDRQSLVVEVRPGVRLPLQVRAGDGLPSVWLGDEELLRVRERDPLAVQTSGGIVDERHREILLQPVLAGVATDVVVSCSRAGESMSTPGALYVDTADNEHALVRAIREGRDFVEQEAEKDNYGVSQSAYAVIRTVAGEPAGLVVADFYQDELRAFRLRMQHTAVIIAAVTFFVSLGASLALAQYILVPVRHLSTAVQQVSSGNLESHVATRRSDELGLLARGFNGMLDSLAASLARRREAEAELLRIAHSDQLTGLPNRASFHERLEENLAAAARAETDRLRGLLFLDLDRFKEVNDTSGHQAGDEVLRKAAALIRGSVRHSDLVFRVGGDEFTVLLTILRSEEDAAIVAGKLVRAFSRPLPGPAGAVSLGLSVGVALYPRDGTTPHDLVRAADAALLAAKRQRGTFRSYQPDMGSPPRA